jgi:3-hydroxyacyl-CoA dehydrogenase / enoyl-CoA hydratase / 3-hydroxybutyryl-CoA epimerase
MTVFTTTITDGLARVVLDLPGEPVNKISRAVRDELDQLLTRLQGDTTVRAVILASGKSDTFIAGADIDEFTALTSRDEARELVRTGQALINRLGTIGKPVVAAIHGACLGGGLEAVLACAYRIATDDPKTKIGFPEVQLGIIPAAGGCQRLPRLIGARAALDIILQAKQLPASRAFRAGIVDELVHPAILDRVAHDAAKRLASGWRPVRKSGGVARLLLDVNPLGRALVFRTARKTVAKRTGGNYPAPFAAIRAIEHGLKHGLEAGLDIEAALFAELAMGEVSRELVRIFFATSALKKDPGVAGEAPAPHPVSRLGIVGAGFMGAGIGGTAVAQAGVDVRFRDADLPHIGKGLHAAERILDDRHERHRITRYELQRLSALLTGGVDWAGFGRADLVIEAVFEDLDVKRDVFRQLEAHTAPEAILASNTSTIPIVEIAKALEHPERVLGMHFFSPVERMPLLEVIVTDETAPWATVSAVAFGKRMGKTVIVVRDRPGFWVNRILAPYLGEAGRLVAEGVKIEVLDAAMKRWGFPVGPIALMDEVGLDVGMKASKVLHDAFGERFEPVPGLAKLVAEGRLGRKSGRGFYRYEKGKKQGVDESVYVLFGAPGGGAGSPAKPAGDPTARLVFAMLNEAARAMDEGVVRSPRDGDVGAVFGIGFPAFRGGPLRLLDAITAAEAVATLEGLARDVGPRFAPAPVLVQMAKDGGRFHSST